MVKEYLMQIKFIFTRFQLPETMPCRLEEYLIKKASNPLT